MFELTIEQAVLIARAAVDIGNDAAIRNGTPQLVREWNSFDAHSQGMALAGVAGTVKAMQSIGFKVVPRTIPELEAHTPAIDDPQGLVSHSAYGEHIFVQPYFGAPPCDALTLTPKGAASLIVLLQAALARCDGSEKEGAGT